MNRFGLTLILVFALLSPQLSHAMPITFHALLDQNENVPTGSPGTGLAVVVFDTDLHTMSIDVTFSGLVGNTTAAHIHCCTSTPLLGNAGVATQTPSFSGFPLGVTSGNYVNVFDMTLASSFNLSFFNANGATAASAEAALLVGALSGKEYFNIHTSAFPGGEIRGFLKEVPVPEPATLVLLGLGLTGLGFSRRKKT